jgi:hypothetical protein
VRERKWDRVKGREQAREWGDMGRRVRKGGERGGGEKE